MIYSMLTILVGSLENGLVLGDFQYNDGSSYALLGFICSTEEKSIYFMIFFKTIVVQFGDKDEEL